MQNVVELKNVNKKYDGFALQNVNIDIPENAIVGFIGQNGAGKTTTISAILNIVKPDSGTIKIFDKDYQKDEYEIKKDMAVIFDEMPFPDIFNLKKVNTMMSGIYDNWNEVTFWNYVDNFSLPHKKPLKKFSKGMKMKAQIAAALSHNAKLLIMDEATTGLDPIVRNEILDIFKQYQTQTHCSIFISSHILSDIDAIADYIVFINNGRVILNDSKEVIINQHSIVEMPADTAINDEIKNFVVGQRVVEGKKEVLLKNYYGFAKTVPAGLEDIMLFYVLGGESN